ncbi:RNA-directed DNA polymerase from mobile element jockey [Nephila pilipes]|uniref:RNA-directed DNA polymerase from mobile element jockey n=1 Tax=Nephila pilipes TaxID=299642 RepID=A0A8X6QT64_NEPPI|nr:RNA-directed DNA polymerase from mobile element jockey [Nephila pilipes]
MTVYLSNQTTADGTLEAIRALRGQETNLKNISFANEAGKDNLTDANQQFQTITNSNKKTPKITPPPPRKQYAPTITIDNIQNSSSLLKKLREITKINQTGKLIAVGDSDARHRSWSNGKPTAIGNKIYNFVQAFDLNVLAPNEPTRIPYHNRGIPSTTDFAITKGLENTAIRTEPHLSSDNHPIFITFHPQNLSTPTNIWLFTNWDDFQTTLENSIRGNPTIESTEKIDNAIANFTEKFTTAINHIAKPRKSNTKPPSEHPTKNPRKE